jgi:hypothetical protein
MDPERSSGKAQMQNNTRNRPRSPIVRADHTGARQRVRLKSVLESRKTASEKANTTIKTIEGSILYDLRQYL